MPLVTQVKMIRALREILLGDGRLALPKGSQPKPDFMGAPAPAPLPRSTPEAQGLSSAFLENFYRDISAIPNANPHALLVLRHGKVVCEGYFAPFRKDVWHVTHSLCKTIVGAAVGIAIAIGEGLFGLDDKLVDHFPKEAGLFPSRHWRMLSVRHLLTMQSGITFNELSEAVETQWIRGIFASPLAFEPGTRFVYNSMNSYLLAALVCKTSGGTLVEFLRPRLFEPLGFGPFAWEKSPEGIEKGGWGAYMTVEDMAKFGQLYLQNGRWIVNGEQRQLIPEDWVCQSTRMQTESDSELDYGHHCWIDTPGGAFTMNGMFGQYITVLPRQDIVVVMTAGNPMIYAESPAYNLIRQTFFAQDFAAERLPENPRAHTSLRRSLAALHCGRTLPPAAPVAKAWPRSFAGGLHAQRWAHPAYSRQEPFGPLDAFLGTTWKFAHNRGGILPIIIQTMDNHFTSGVKAIHLEPQQGFFNLMWEEGRGTLSLPVGPENSPMQRLIHVGQESFLVACGAVVHPNEDGEAVLIIEIFFLEHSSRRLLKLTRRNENILLQMDEQPQFSHGVEGVLMQNESTAATPAKKNGSLSDMVMSSDYVYYRVGQLCTPQLIGKPFVASEG